MKDMHSKYDNMHKNRIFYALICINNHVINRINCMLSKSSSPREKEKKGENSYKPCMGTLSCGFPPPIYRHLVCGYFIKILIIMSISTNIHTPYMCHPLGPYISIVNNSINSPKSYWSTLINYLYQHID